MKLKAQKRDTKENLKAIRKSGKIPAVFYGQGVESIPVTVTSIDFIKTYKEKGRSSFLTLDVEGDEMQVLIKTVEYHPVKDNVTHVDFYVPRKGYEMEADVPFNFIGEPKAEKAGNVVSKILVSAKIKTLPKDLPDNIDVNIENLEKVGDTITLNDIKLPEGVSFLTDDLSEVIINISAPKTADEENEENASELEVPKEEENSDEEK